MLPSSPTRRSSDLATMSVEPAKLNRLTFLLDPTCTTTRFGIVSPGTKFTFDAVGRETPDGHTVTNPGDVGFVTVTFNTTAAAFAGTPDTPATRRSRD